MSCCYRGSYVTWKCFKLMSISENFSGSGVLFSVCRYWAIPVSIPVSSSILKHSRSGLSELNMFSCLISISFPLSVAISLKSVTSNDLRISFSDIFFIKISIGFYNWKPWKSPLSSFYCNINFLCIDLSIWNSDYPSCSFLFWFLSFVFFSSYSFKIISLSILSFNNLLPSSLSLIIL